MNSVTDTKLWEQLKTDEHRVLVKQLTKKAADKLDLVRDSFPTYTLHNEKHSLNVISLMEKLLGNDIKNLTELEAALLILSAYYHDIGMVFTEEERNNLQDEAHFDQFLNKHSKANLTIKQHQVSGDEDLPIDIAEWYCRWIHPQRSHDYILNHNISWNNYPIQHELAIICKSHGDDIKQLNHLEKLSIDFIGEADLLFCAILLRLADILDFDNSRSPEEVYKYLGLAEKREKRKQESDIEWRKHLCANGFTFKNNNRNERYPIKFIAAPNHPSVEYDVRQFLDIIEVELEKCHKVLASCSEKWREFKLPLNIDRSNIKSVNYAYGEHRFTLDQNQILDLLMGENLYSDPYVFVRELVQNAIDTSRHRVVYEHNKGNTNFQADAIEFSTWMDCEGYTWVRVDDYGMGMDESIIANYFLKVGKSYYESDEFEIEKLNWKSDFKPISRFGIGILSCFIVGDRIEVNTRKVITDPKRNALRLSMQGLDTFYILQKEESHPNCKEMPNEPKKAEKYREPKKAEKYRENNKLGTSIAVRFDPRKYKGDFNLEEQLNHYIAASPVLVKFNDHEIGLNYEKHIKTPWIEPFEYELTDNEQQTIEDTLNFKFSQHLKLKFIPLDITKHSPNPNLAGQAITIYLDIPHDNAIELENNKKLFSIEVDVEKQNIIIHASTESKQRLIAKRTNEIELKIKDEFSKLPPSITYSQIQSYLKSILKVGDIPIIPDNNPQEVIRGINCDYLLESTNSYKEIYLIIAEICEDIAQFRKYAQKLSDEEKKFKITIPIKKLQIDISPFIEKYELSHNGVSIPKISNNDRHFQLRSPIKGGLIYYHIALQDNLRPDLSLARDEVRSFSWQFYSSVNLAFLKVLDDFQFEQNRINLDIFDHRGFHKKFILEEISKDIHLDEDWGKQRIIEYRLGSEHHFMNISDIVTKLKERGGEIPLICRVKIYDHTSEFFHRIPFYYRIVAALIQRKFDVKFNTGSSHLIIIRDKPSNTHDTQNYYPPLFFVEYEGNDKLFRKSHYPINLKHPLTRWLLDNTEKLAEQHLALLQELETTISLTVQNTGRVDNKTKLIDETNNILTLLRELNYENKPTESIFLKSEDIEISI